MNLDFFRVKSDKNVVTVAMASPFEFTMFAILKLYKVVGVEKPVYGIKWKKLQVLGVHCGP